MLGLVEIRCAKLSYVVLSLLYCFSRKMTSLLGEAHIPTGSIVATAHEINSVLVEPDNCGPI